MEFNLWGSRKFRRADMAGYDHLRLDRRTSPPAFQVPAADLGIVELRAVSTRSTTERVSLFLIATTHVVCRGPDARATTRRNGTPSSVPTQRSATRIPLRSRAPDSPSR